MNLLITAYFAAILVQVAIRHRIDQARRRTTKVDRRVTAREHTSLVLLFVGLLLVPLVHAVTPWLEFADYAVPALASAAGLLVLAASLLVFWRGHADLGINWSPSLEIRERHELVTHGIYRVIRHPMYASILLWAVAQPLLLHNYIAGGLGPVCTLAFYVLRVGPEEQMMLDAFGDRYREYMRNVGGVIPRLP